MIGKLVDGPVTIVGGGVSGLLLAYREAKRGRRVHLVEASDRLGGLIWTHPFENGIAENGAHSILATQTVRQFLNEIGVDWERCQSKTRWLYKNGQKTKWPLTIAETLTTAWQALTQEAPLDSTDGSIERLDEWGNHFLGEAATRELLDPMVCGIYGVRPDELDVAAAFPALLPQRGKGLLSLRKGRMPDKGKSMAAPVRGMGAITEALEAKLRAFPNSQVQIETSKLFSRLNHHEPNLALCVPAQKAASILETWPEFSKLASDLRSIRYVPLVSCTVLVDRSHLARLPEGVGILFSTASAYSWKSLLGILFNSSSFSNRATPNQVSMTFILGGSRDPAVEQVSDAWVEANISEAIGDLFGWSGVPRFSSKIVRHARAVPVYDKNLRRFWEVASKTWCATPGHVLFGNYTGQVSVRGLIESLYCTKINDGDV